MIHRTRREVFAPLEHREKVRQRGEEKEKDRTWSARAEAELCCGKVAAGALSWSCRIAVLELQERLGRSSSAALLLTAPDSGLDNCQDAPGATC